METSTKEKNHIYMIFDIFIAGIIVFLVIAMLGYIPAYEVDYSDERYNFGIIELSVIILSLLILSAIFRKISVRKTRVNTLVFYLVFSYSMILIFQLLKKYLFYFLIEKPIDKNTYLGQLLNEFRFSSVFAAITCYLMYIFFMELFGKTDKREKLRKMILGFTTISIILQFVTLTQDNNINRIISMGVILLLSLYTYTPIAIKSYKMVNRMKTNKEDEESRQIYYGFFFLFLIALFLVLSWSSALISIFYDMATDTSYGPFYKLQMVFTVCMLLNIYIGFVMPKWFKKYLLKQK